MAWPRIPLEDDPSDVLRKAMRGNGLDAAELERRTGLPAAAIAGWTRGKGVPRETEARAVATVLRLDPGKFADAAARRWFPETIVPDDVRHHSHDPHPSNGYLFFLGDGQTAALIDPAGLPSTLLRAVNEGPYRLRYILITHKHADHCDATADVARAFPDAQIVMHRADVAAIGSYAARAHRRLVVFSLSLDALHRRHAFCRFRRRYLRRRFNLRRPARQRTPQTLHARRHDRGHARPRAALDDRAGTRTQPVLLGMP